MASLSSFLSASPYCGSKKQPFRFGNRRHYCLNYVPCRASNGEQTPRGGDSLSKFDRRDVLFGLGGLYGMATLGGDRRALADSQSPDVLHCQLATIAGDVKTDCCPPPFHGIVDFVLPPPPEKLRVRPAAHSIPGDQLAKFEKAIYLMKHLDKDDPRNFYRQANVHCAYCNYAYKQEKFCTSDFEVHWNALFFPFHRAYLYFFERILGHLIGDENFAIPFWNWDAVPGMQFPDIYNNSNSPLYDKIRDARHVSNKLLDLNYNPKDEYPSYDVLDCNVRWMHKQVMVDGKTAEGFLGHLIRGGDEAGRKGQGTIERSPHNNVHDWVGDPNSKYGEDMGNFYSAGRDPVFYAHHGNVDRMWNIWQGLTDVPRDYKDPDWLESSFVFYDEHKRAVRIRVCQCLDSKKLGYVYQDVEIPWLHTKQIPRQRSLLKESQPSSSSSSTEPQLAPPPILSFPQNLDLDINTSVQRPVVPRTGKQLTEEDEVLVIQDIEFDATSRVHFNVLVNVLDDGDDVCPGNVEFAGNFTNIPHGHKRLVKTSLRLVITEVIQELGLENDETVSVRIVPKVGGDKVTIGGINIELQPIN